MEPKTLPARFFLTDSGSAPVREFLLDLSADDRKTVGIAIARVEFGWPVGMPICRILVDQIWEVRVSLATHKIVRILFTPYEGEAILLHAFVKKTQKTPKSELAIAIRRKKQLLEAHRNE